MGSCDLLCFLDVSAFHVRDETALVVRDLTADRLGVDGADGLLDGRAGHGVLTGTTAVQLRQIHHGMVINTILSFLF